MSEQDLSDHAPVAFLGLGTMGLPMAANIARSGVPVTGYDPSPTARQRGAEQGLDLAGSAQEAADRSSVVITMLPDTPDVEACLLGPSGIAAVLSPGSTVIDMSTISPTATVSFGEALRDVDVAFLDAPVSGGVRGAIAGTLSIMVGGRAADYERVLPLLAAMGKATHMGAWGAGQATKLCNQVAVALHIQAACEALVLGRRLGVNLEALVDALSGGAAQSWVLDNLAPQMLAGDDSAGFRIALQLKDLRLAAEAAMQVHVPLPAAANVTALYTEAMAHGEESNGNQALFRVYERLSGLSLRSTDAATPDEIA